MSIDSAKKTVVFTPSGKRGRFAIGVSLLTCAHALGVDLDSICGGRGICGRCRVGIGEGELAKYGIISTADHLEPVTPPEKLYAAREGLGRGMRLACHARICGDIVVDVPPESQIHRQIVRKRAEARSIDIDPVIRLYFVEVAKPDMASPSGDFERLAEALETQWDIFLGGIDYGVLCTLQDVLREGEWRVTVALWKGSQIVRLWPGFHDVAYGIAIDVGSTTIAAHLCDLASGDVLGSCGLMNPQIRFGEDLMSRVSYAMLNGGGGAELRASVRQGVNGAITSAAAEAGVAAEDILSLSIVGNPVMHHILLGLDSVPLGTAPFALGTASALDLRAGEIGIDSVKTNACIYVLPCIAGHVGADTAAMVLSEGPHLEENICLLIDVGTNAEIVLGNKDRLLAASSPTGPAFEGAQISHGQRAAPGAIERVRIDRQTLEPRFKIIGSDLWSDEAGFARGSAKTGVTGICGSGIIEAVAEMYLAGILSADGVVDGAQGQKTRRIVSRGRTHGFILHEGRITITITQSDVRAIQLAKAALYAGARLLMDKLGVEQVDKIVLAGAFGSTIDARYAMVLGMIPDCDPEAVSSAGNAAGTGAWIALLNQGARAEIEEVVKSIEKIETALEPRFQEHFIAAMAIPHQSAPFARLRKFVDLPAKKTAAVGKPGRRGRTRRV